MTLAMPWSGWLTPVRTGSVVPGATTALSMTSTSTKLLTRVATATGTATGLACGPFGVSSSPQPKKVSGAFWFACSAASQSSTSLPARTRTSSKALPPAGSGVGRPRADHQRAGDGRQGGGRRGDLGGARDRRRGAVEVKGGLSVARRPRQGQRLPGRRLLPGLGRERHGAGARLELRVERAVRAAVAERQRAGGVGERAAVQEPLGVAGGVG